MFSNKKAHVFKVLLFCIFTFTIYSNAIYSQNSNNTIVYQTIKTSLSHGDIETLAPLFNSKIDITLPNLAGIYSNTQAFYILNTFFENNPPVSFQIINETHSSGSNFIVGKMHTKDKHFRVCYLTKKTNGKIYIYQIQIEK